MDKEIEKITNKHLAELIIDELINAKLIQEESFEFAVEIATEEIDVRKAAGDY